MMPAEEVRAERDRLWARVFALYRTRPAVGTLGAEVIGLALETEELIAREPAHARAPIQREGQGRRVVAGPRGAGSVTMPRGTMLGEAEGTWKRR